MKSEADITIFGPTKFWQITILVVILICGFTTRLYDLTDPPLDYASTRQLRSAIIARGIYFGAAEDVSDRERTVALSEMNSQEKLEPEIFETLIAFVYLIVGGEYVWIARIFSSLFWTLGGLALYSLTKEMVSDAGAVIALIFYLFTPFGLLASRTFQPDPMMTAAIILSWLSFYRWSTTRTWKGALIAGLAAGGTILIKPTSVFFLFFGMAVVVITEYKLRYIFKDLQIWLIGALSAAPAVLYNLYGYFISGNLRGQFKGRLFNPKLWGDLAFYSDWLRTTNEVLGHRVIFIAALLGLILIRKKTSRGLLVGTWIGFGVFGFAVSYYVTTHSYYLLPIIPLAAISIGAVADWVFTWLVKIKLRGLIWAGTLAVVILGVGLGYYTYQRKDFRHEPGYYFKVASYVSPDDKIIALSQDYGFRLAYYGWINLQNWTRLERLIPPGEKITEQDSYSSRFETVMEKYDFFIITRMKDFREQPDLRNELTDHYPVLVESGGFMIFDLRERLD